MSCKFLQFGAFEEKLNQQEDEMHNKNPWGLFFRYLLLVLVGINLGFWRSGDLVLNDSFEITYFTTEAITTLLIGAVVLLCWAGTFFYEDEYHEKRLNRVSRKMMEAEKIRHNNPHLNLKAEKVDRPGHIGKHYKINIRSDEAMSREMSQQIAERLLTLVHEEYPEDPYIDVRIEQGYGNGPGPYAPYHLEITIY